MANQLQICCLPALIHTNLPHFTHYRVLYYDSLNSSPNSSPNSSLCVNDLDQIGCQTIFGDSFQGALASGCKVHFNRSPLQFILWARYWMVTRRLLVEALATSSCNLLEIEPYNLYVHSDCYLKNKRRKRFFWNASLPTAIVCHC